MNVNYFYILILFFCLLLVEDDLCLCEDFDVYFCWCGFCVIVCGDGLYGLEVVGCEVFDLVLLDIMLFGFDGLVLLELLCCEQVMLVMLMLVLGVEQDCISGFICGVDDYLLKLFSLVELDVCIDVLLCCV